MKRRHWLLVISLIFAAWGMDQITKIWAVQALGRAEFFGPFGFVLHRNPGAILGTFSSLPPLLRIVTLSTGGAFLICIYAAIQYLLPGKSLMLRSGLSLLLGGILGNVTDRILSGSVVDFLLLGNEKWSTPAFNLADAIQWVGYAMVVGFLIRDGKQIWPSANERKRIWVNPGFQIKYIVILMSIGIGFSLICGVFSYTYLRVTIETLLGVSPKLVEERFLGPFVITFVLIALGFSLMLFVVGRHLSHRTAGPLYAFERFLEDVLDGRDRPLRLRDGDEFAHLERLAESIRERVKTRYALVTPLTPATAPSKDTQSGSTAEPTPITVPGTLALDEKKFKPSGS